MSDTPGYGHWIGQAETCRRIAARTSDEIVRAHLLDLAARCDAFAAASVPRVRPKARASSGEGIVPRLMFAKPVQDPGSDVLIAARPRWRWAGG